MCLGSDGVDAESRVCRTDDLKLNTLSVVCVVDHDRPRRGCAPARIPNVVHARCVEWNEAVRMVVDCRDDDIAKVVVRWLV